MEITGKSNAEKYDCPRCLHDFPDRDSAYDKKNCLSCVCGSNFLKREISEGERFYNMGAQKI